MTNLSGKPGGRATAVPTRLYTTLLAMLMLLPSLATAGGEYGQGLLWRVVGPGGATSHVFGTMHVEDPRVTALPPPVEKAFTRADRLVLEIVPDQAMLLSLAAALQAGTGTDLSKLLDPTLYRKTVAAMAERGLPEPLVKQMQPWAVALTLSAPPAQTGQALDVLLYLRASRAGRPVLGLETVDEQIGIFSELSQDDQIQLLRETLKELPRMDHVYRELIDAYLARDLERLAGLSDETLAGADTRLGDTLRRRAVTDRNARMAERMREWLDQGGTFVAVGALHLYGDEGVIGHLAADGYQVTPLY